MLAFMKKSKVRHTPSLKVFFKKLNSFSVRKTPALRPLILGRLGHGSNGMNRTRCNTMPNRQRASPARKYVISKPNNEQPFLETTSMKHRLALLAICATLLTGLSSVNAQSAGDIQVNITNEGNSDFTTTPLWFAFHDGTFDTFDVGSSASSAIELIAEDGMVGGLQSDFSNSGQPGLIQGVAAAPGGFAGAPVIEPGETGQGFATPNNPAGYQYISFASMIIPTNDTFFGNDNPLAHQVFDANGNINDASGIFTIQIFAEDLYDAGTEDNTAAGLPFATNAGATATDTAGGLIAQAGDLSEFSGLTTPSGITITNLVQPGQLVATIQVSRVAAVPEPSSLAVVGLGLGGMLLRRRRS